jgi:hypothetical protein
VIDRAQSDRNAPAQRQSFAWRLVGVACGVAIALATGCSNGEVVQTKAGPGAEGGVLRGGDDASQGDDDASQGEGGIDQQTVVGTTGRRCSSDSDCTSADGDTCSVDYPIVYAGVTGPALPVAVCMESPLADNCDPAPATDPFGSVPHFCDGPDDPSSPGICLPDNFDNPQSGMGTCIPKCTFSTGGAAAVGCTAPDTCTPLIYAQEGATILGFGYCQGTCQSDADCSPQSGVAATCQTDVGICTTQTVPRTLDLGDPCTFNDYESGNCNCDVDPATGSGFCTTVCVVGGAPCPTGWVCDSGALSSVTIGNNTITLTTQNPGLAGFCLPACPASAVAQSAPVVVDGGADDAESTGSNGDAEAPVADASADSGATIDAMVAPPPAEAGASPAPDAGFQCPAASTCTVGTLAGPDCQP